MKPTLTRTCSKCKQDKEEDEFYSDNSRVCKSCKRFYQTMRYHHNKVLAKFKDDIIDEIVKMWMKAEDK